MKITVEDLAEQRNRTTGRTTRLIIETVQHCLDRPGLPVVCKDHTDSPYMNEFVFNDVTRILGILAVGYHTTHPHTITVIPLPKRTT